VFNNAIVVFFRVVSFSICIHDAFLIQERRKTPEFILLGGNTTLASSTANVSSLLEVLTEHTWGLGITCNDYHALSLDPQIKISRKNEKSLNKDYKEM
jgi:hypothetical protein